VTLINCFVYLFDFTGNSIKFTEHGSVQLRVSAELCPNEAVPSDLDLVQAESHATGPQLPHIDASQLQMYKLHIAIQDTGCGISAAQQGKLFQDYTQANKSINARFGGTGLGLSISRHLVKLHGGNIWLESNAAPTSSSTSSQQQQQQPSGTTFHIELTLPACNIALPVYLQRDIACQELKNKHILIVKQNPVYAGVLRRCCEFWGMQVTIVASYMECCRVFDAHLALLKPNSTVTQQQQHQQQQQQHPITRPFDVILMDWDVNDDSIYSPDSPLERLPYDDHELLADAGDTITTSNSTINASKKDSKLASPPASQQAPYSSTVASSRVPADKRTRVPTKISSRSSMTQPGNNAGNTSSTSNKKSNKTGLDLASHFRRLAARRNVQDQQSSSSSSAVVPQARSAQLPIILCIPLSLRKKLMRSIVNCFMSHPLKPAKLFACLVSMLHPTSLSSSASNNNASSAASPNFATKSLQGTPASQSRTATGAGASPASSVGSNSAATTGLIGLRTSQLALANSQSIASPLRRLMEERIRDADQSPEFMNQNKQRYIDTGQGGMVAAAAAAANVSSSRSSNLQRKNSAHASTASAASNAASKISADFAKSYPLRICVADDVSLNQKLIATMLKRLGYIESQITIVSNGQQALDTVLARLQDPNNASWIHQQQQQQAQQPSHQSTESSSVSILPPSQAFIYDAASSTAPPSAETTPQLSVDLLAQQSSTSAPTTANYCPMSISGSRDSSCESSYNVTTPNTGASLANSNCSEMSNSPLARRRTGNNKSSNNSKQDKQSNAASAALIQQNQTLPFELCLMDCQMPVLDGFASTRAIRAWCAEHSIPMTKQPVIAALTGNAMQGDKARCLEVMDDCELTFILQQR
jgi:CheY-like chemotaxis protein